MKHHLEGVHKGIVTCNRCPENIKKSLKMLKKTYNDDLFQEVKVTSGSESEDTKKGSLDFFFI